MLTNIYKGQTTGWYEFDKIIYGNARDNLDPVDEVMLGRYILLCYCDTAFTEDEKLEIENETSGENLLDDRFDYWENYNADGKVSKDRMIYKKVYKDKKIQYIEIGRINEIKEGNLNFSGEKTPEGGEIFNDYENNQARTPMSSARGEGTVAGGKGFKIKHILAKERDEVINLFNPFWVTLKEYNFDTYIHYEDITIKPGVTITPNADGTFNMNCASDYEELKFMGQIGSIDLEPGIYVLKMSLSLWTTFEYDSNTGIIDLTNATETTSIPIIADIYPNETQNNLYVQITEGEDTTIPYTPYYVPYGYVFDDAIDITSIHNTDVYSVRIGSNYDNIGKIIGVNTADNVVYTDVSTFGTTTTLTNAYLWLPVIPEDWSTYDDPQTKTSLKATRKINAGTTYMDAAQYAEGTETYAINYAAHAEGNRSVAAGRWSHAEGNGTYAAYAAHSEGSKTKAIGQCSHAQGNETEASGYAAHSGGSKTIASGDYSFAHGMQNQASGQYSTAIGYKNEATAESAVAIGYENKTMAKGSVSLGVGNTIDEGSVYSIALGQNLKIQNNSNFTINLGRDNLIGGLEDIGAHYSATIGQGLITKAGNQIAVGKYNNPDKITNHNQPVFMVGYGTSDSNRKNVFEVDRNGVATVGADPIDNMDVATKQYVDNSISSLNPTVDLSGYMPLTGGEIINEENLTASIIINPNLLKINYVITGSNSFIQMGANKEIGYDEQQFCPKFSGYIELSNEKCNEIPDSTFTITAIGVEGNNTAKASWRQWLGITTEDGPIDLSALENKITQLENKIKELENASPVLKE